MVFVREKYEYGESGRRTVVYLLLLRLTAGGLASLTSAIFKGKYLVV